MPKLPTTFAQHLITKQVKREREEAKGKRDALANEDQLALLEGIIDRGWQTFLEVGCALQEIRDNKLWKPSYANFEAYVANRWDWTKRYANNVIRAATVARALSPTPKNEALTRVLAPLYDKDPDLAQEIWEAATSINPDPTAKELKAFIRDPQPAAPPKPQDDFTVRTLAYLKNMISNFDADRARRQRFLIEIHSYVQEQMFRSHGLRRLSELKPSASVGRAVREGPGLVSYPESDPPFEEPSAEYPDGRFI